LGKSAAAIGAWHRPELIEHLSLIAPSRSLTLNPRRCGLDPRRKPLSMSIAAPEAMAIHANDVALSRLREDLLAALERGAA